MLLILDPTSSNDVITTLEARLDAMGFSPYPSDEQDPRALCLVEPVSPHARQEIRQLPGVKELVEIKEPYKLASRAFHPSPTLVRVGRAVLGGDAVVMMAGPCAVESREHIHAMARLVKQAGIPVLRGGAFKPRTSPYAFQGHGEEGLKWMREAADANDLAIVSEVMDASQIPMMLDYVDVLQVGARNMQNFSLLSAVGKVQRPVLLKRGISATILEWLMAAEYILAGGNGDVVLCERGIRTFERATRNTFDVSAVPVLKQLTHLPVVVDPSHASGVRDLVIPLARAGVAAGADGCIVEFHTCPEEAFSDGPQSLYPEQLEQLVRELDGICRALGRRLD
ncbi:MAG TPA: 3-deoxy-7-phosphoheptulonate synthase [Holophaga sp.]|jgi:3-deoxy-7-phosphoheptulonate synthase|nr:3-deoxy-7-phosphoheptulonate synthase [Holophaga sp.]